MITTHEFPGAQAEKAVMKSWILERRELDPSGNIAPSSGWSSAKDLFASGPWTNLLSFILGRIDYPGSALFPEPGKVEPPTWEVSAWANIMTKDHRVLFHHHMRSHKGGPNYAAGVYYVEAPPGSSPIHFWPDGYVGPKITLEVEDGVLILFPAFLPHSVPAHPLKEDRISVAFNIRKADL